MTGTSSSRQFGLMIAYVLPGFIGLAGVAPLFPAVARWLRPAGAQGDLGLGAPLYAVLAATAVGLVLSCFRWLLLDHVHEWMGVTRPTWDDSQLEQVLGGFDYLVQAHYRYYEFVGNTLLALLWSYGLNRWLGTHPFLGTATDIAVLVVAAVLFTASRDALANYYTRTGRLIGHFGANEDGGIQMYNGNDHTSGAGKAQEKPKSKPEQPKPAAPVKAPSPSEGTRQKK